MEKTIQKSDLVEIIATECELPKTKAKAVLDCITDTIIKNVVDGKEVAIRGFGTFERVIRNEKKTCAFGKETIIPKHYGMTFSVGSPVKDALAEKMKNEK